MMRSVLFLLSTGLQRMGEKGAAEIVSFSPLNDFEVPDVDRLVFGGGFLNVLDFQLSSIVNERVYQPLMRKGMPIYA